MRCGTQRSRRKTRFRGEANTKARFPQEQDERLPHSLWSKDYFSAVSARIHHGEHYL